MAVESQRSGNLQNPQNPHNPHNPAKKALDNLDEDIARTQARLNALREMREKLEIIATDGFYGAMMAPVTKFATVADAAEDVLREACETGETELGIDQIYAGLEARRVKATMKSLSNTLHRWASRGRRFRRVGPQKFALKK
jgi:hypothetical protein